MSIYCLISSKDGGEGQYSSSPMPLIEVGGKRNNDGGTLSMLNASDEGLVVTYKKMPETVINYN